jgi:predicted HNH restriction endonuclease
MSRKGTYAHKGTEKHCCRICNDDNPDNFYGAKKTECKSCFNRRSIERRQSHKKRAVELLGGKCSICGYNKYIGALEFHHTDPTKKDMTIAGSGKKWETIKEEVEKCMLLCANCHREMHCKLRICE